jgi:hypothetical protein
MLDLRFLRDFSLNQRTFIGGEELIVKWAKGSAAAAWLVRTS